MYKAGVENKVADALSRQFEDDECHVMISYPIWQQGGDTNEEVQYDAVLQNTINELSKDPKSKPGYSIHGAGCFIKIGWSFLLLLP